MLFIGTSLLLGLSAAYPVAAHAANPPNCIDYIDAYPEMPGQPAEPEDSSDYVEAWYDIPADDPYDHIDGRRIESVEQLVKRLAQSTSVLHVIYYADFSNWDFTRIASPLEGLCFYRSNLSASRWDKVNLARSAFVQSDLSKASFRGSNLQKVLFDDVAMEDADMSQADLWHGRLSGGWFRELELKSATQIVTTGLNGWRLNDANLTFFRFDCGIEVSNGCPLDRQINFSGANLAAADLVRFPGWGQFNVAGARLSGTQMAPNQLEFFGDARIDGKIVLAGPRTTAAFEQVDAENLIRQFGEAYALESRRSFDCNLAQNRVEHMICSEEGEQQNLDFYDRQLADLYAVARVKDPNIVNSQKAWIRERNRCAGFSCIVDQYQARIAVLGGAAGEPSWIARGERVLFVGGQPDVPDAVKSDAIWRRLLPVLADSAMEKIIVTHSDDGLWSIRGRSIGANAHVCSLDVEGLRFDRSSGWFVLQTRSGKMPVFRIFGQQLQILGDGHPDTDIYPDIEVASCGVRASFTWSRHIAVSADDLAETWLLLGS
ncbi:MAG: pentapeptide repeat-containing protein [Pontixanthobacter sp.]